MVATLHTYEPHPELVVTTPVSTIAGKTSEVYLKGKIIDVSKGPTKSVLKIVMTAADDIEKIALTD